MKAFINRKAQALLGLVHMMGGLNTGALPALLPFLKTTFGLYSTMLGLLVNDRLGDWGEWSGGHGPRRRCRYMGYRNGDAMYNVFAALALDLVLVPSR